MSASVYSILPTSVTCHMDSLFEAGFWGWTVQVFDGGTKVAQTGGSTNSNYTTTGDYSTATPLTGQTLIPDKTYYVYVYYKSYQSGPAHLANTYSITGTGWKWSTTELTALNDNGRIDVITYSRWNSFLSAIDLVLYNRKVESMTITQATRISQNMIYQDNGADLSYSALLYLANMTSTNKTLLATRFNTARYCIGAWSSTGVSVVNAGDNVMGSYFIALQDALNSIVKPTNW